MFLGWFDNLPFGMLIAPMSLWLNPFTVTEKHGFSMISNGLAYSQSMCAKTFCEVENLFSPNGMLEHS